MILLRFAVAAAAVIGGLSAASAQTVSYADAMGQLASSCGGDIERHCRGVNLGDDGIKNCLAANQGKLSAACQAGFMQPFAEIDQRYAAQMAFPHACQTDARRLCLVVPGDGHYLDCLLKAQPSVSASCNAAINAAGFR